MNVIEFFSRQKGMEKGTKRRKIGGGCWTSDAKRSGKYCGWSADGIEWFNQLCQLIKNDRSSHPEFDRKFLMNMQNQGNNVHQFDRATSKTIIVYDDFDMEVNEV